MNADIDVSGVTLYTPRLTLRPWRMEDLDDFFAYARVDGVGQMVGWKPHESREGSLRILSRFIEGKKTFALEMEGRAIGSLGVERYDEARFPELAPLRCRMLGFVLAKEHWGKVLCPRPCARSVAGCLRRSNWTRYSAPTFCATIDPRAFSKSAASATTPMAFITRRWARWRMRKK